jgi:hypothetical protein
MDARWMVTVSEVGNGTVLMEGFTHRSEAEARLDALIDLLGDGHIVRLFDRLEGTMIDEVEV